jgi:fermentation-respiration switch protein FrsA (DUF1100 family)
MASGLPVSGALAQKAGVAVSGTTSTAKVPIIGFDWTLMLGSYPTPTNQAPDVIVKPVESSDALVQHIAFKGSAGDTVPGLFARPKADGVYPVVLLLHGLTSDKEAMMHYFSAPLVQLGYAVLALDAPLHGERQAVGQDPSAPANFPHVVHNGVLDYQIALNYLQKRKDVNGKRIALLGYSMGSMMGAILGGIDERVGAFALCVGGDPILPLVNTVPDGVRPFLLSVSPSLYIGHIAPRPILMLNGTADTEMSREASDRLYAAAGQPKKQIWYQSGHVLPTEAGQKAVSWLKDQIDAMNHPAAHTATGSAGG